jgi:hypothetical protein
VVRKFKDDDKDGIWDSNEGATGRTWQFEYRLNDGPWIGYQTDATHGWGSYVYVNQDTKVEIKEIEASGWVNTTGLAEIRVLNENKTYYFDFGNYPQPEVVISSPPPTVPQTGTASSLTWSMLVLGAGIVLQLLALLL